jgi:hypothetical protein
MFTYTTTLLGPQSGYGGNYPMMTREFFLFEVRGYEGSSARIVEFTSEEIIPVLEVYRGGC